jgi:hypothetical protein
VDHEAAERDRSRSRAVRGTFDTLALGAGFRFYGGADAPLLRKATPDSFRSETTGEARALVNRRALVAPAAEEA